MCCTGSAETSSRMRAASIRVLMIHSLGDLPVTRRNSWLR
jgi:hypothetical protein